jgi:hypothetical protein
MLIVNDEHRIAAGIKSLSKRCPYCRKPLQAYPLILSDDAGFAVFHAACAAALAIEIQVDLYTFFHPPAQYHQFFVLTTQEAERNDEQGGTDGKKREERADLRTKSEQSARRMSGITIDNLEIRSTGGPQRSVVVNSDRKSSRFWGLA